VKDKVTIHSLKKQKQAGQKICMVTSVRRDVRAHPRRGGRRRTAGGRLAGHGGAGQRLDPARHHGPDDLPLPRW